MKNMKVAKKLIVSFMIVIAMIIAMGIFSVINMLQIDTDYSESYELMAVPMPYMAHILANMQEMRVCSREFALGVSTNDSTRIEKAYQIVQANIRANEELLDKYSATIISPEAKAFFAEAHDLYEKEYLGFIQETYQLALAGREQELNDDIVAIAPTMNKIIDDFKTCLELKSETGSATSDELSQKTQNIAILVVGIIVAVTAVSIFLAFYISGLIAKPLTPLSAFLKKAGTTGDLVLQAQDSEMLKKYSQSKDEIGETISSASTFIEYITYIAGNLERIAGGDLTFEVNTLSAEDTLGNSMKNMLASLNNMFGNINASMAQVATGSKQIAGGAQSLAQGTTEQAASIEELSSSIADIAETIKENAAIALKTSSLSNDIKDSAEKGNNQMNDMITAVGEINEASRNISKIIKTIDDIAFQTNILALNAAVEAARAGQHGKGFAVVAEEVRNLASKSAEAAKDTGDMIQNSMEKAELGTRIAGETARSLTYIVAGINESSLLIAEIAEASEKQSHGIVQINVGIDQVAQVVQQNSATAEESAAASEQINSQSAVLQQLIAQFKLKDSISTSHGLPPSQSHTQKRLAPPAPPVPEKAEYANAGIGGSFGKY
jgi:methyl-accepting chemotaxis protein